MAPIESDINLWLERALVNENLVDFSTEILGRSGQIDGYSGSVTFVKILGKTRNSNSFKHYNVVVKCGSQIEEVRKNLPLNAIYHNEKYFYENVFPALTQFQIEKGVEEPFSSIAKYYATLIDKNVEIIILENLKSKGYTLYDREKTFTKDHLKLILEEYAKLHASAAAMQHQQPEKFHQIVGEIKNIFPMLAETMDIPLIFGSPIDEITELLKDDLKPHHIEKLKKFKEEVPYIIKELLKDTTRFSTICHGDCWNNNFLFQYEDESEQHPAKVAILDWQIMRYCHPATDLSFAMYTTISKEDLNDFDDLLKFYYHHFSEHLRRLGSDPETIFSYSELEEDWKKFGKFGLVMAFLHCKNTLSQKNEIIDGTETDLTSFKIKDKLATKSKMLHIIEHAITKDFI